MVTLVIESILYDMYLNDINLFYNHHVVSAMALSHRTYPPSFLQCRLRSVSPKCVQLVMIWFRSHVAEPHIQFLLSRFFIIIIMYVLIIVSPIDQYVALVFVTRFV